MKRILLVEDDAALGTTLSERLRREGYQLRWAQNYAEATTALNVELFDAAIIDISLPDGDGFAIARHPKASGRLPILFLTAMNSAECRLEAFELGAADYIPKPFHLQELIIRLRRMLAPLADGPRAEIIDCGPFRLNAQGSAIEFADGATEFLPTKEFQLLKTLVQASPAAISREELCEKIWGEAANQRTVDNSILKLRQVLERTGKEWIRSVRGVGYQWS